MSEWKPIETSPKDGSEYLAYCANTGERFVCISDEEGDHIYARTGRIQFKCEPDYWTTLPEPPDA